MSRATLEDSRQRLADLEAQVILLSCRPQLLRLNQICCCRNPELRSLSCLHMVSSAVWIVHQTSWPRAQLQTSCARALYHLTARKAECAGRQIVEVASTSCYQLQLQQLQAEEAAASAKAAAEAKQAELQTALDSLQQVSRTCTVSCKFIFAVGPRQATS